MSAPARLAYLVVDAVDLTPGQMLGAGLPGMDAVITDGPSLWGHERSWLAQPLRERARALRLQASEKGLKAPLPNQV